MITKEQAVNLHYGQELHFGECKKRIGPRGGIKIEQTRVRVSGKTQTWKTRPAEFRVPVKYGLYESSEITHRNGEDFHTYQDCTLDQG